MRSNDLFQSVQLRLQLFDLGQVDLRQRPTRGIEVAGELDQGPGIERRLLQCSKQLPKTLQGALRALQLTDTLVGGL
ncbi:hypothetical protein D3C87_1772930 [compost metagenome]